MTNISTTATTTQDDDHAVIEAGYKPQLKRSLGFFSSFAVSFSFMSVLMGIFANYGYVLGKAGPFGLWTWLLVGGGQLLVALVFAEMAGRIPLTGALYNWNTRLANPTVGWFTAWLLFFAYSVGYVGVVAAMFAPMQTFFGLEFSPNTIRVIGVGIFVTLALINIYGVRLAAHTNKIAVVAELIALVVFGVILLGVISFTGEIHTSLLTTIPQQPTPYWPSFLMASLLAAWTIFGFESPADLSEETVDVRSVTPKSIITSVLATVALGAAFLGIITLAIPDLGAVTASSDPVSAIVSYHLGSAATKIFLAIVLVAMFASAIVGVTAASRILFAVARDKQILGSSVFAHVSTHHVPKAAIVLVAFVQISAFLLFQNFADLYATPVVLLAIAYLITVISFIVGIKKLPPAKGFSLGKWHEPVVIGALVWLVSEICILTAPEEFHSVAMIAGGIIAAGFVLYFVTGRRGAKG
jgi:amino acid transporter